MSSISIRAVRSISFRRRAAALALVVCLALASSARADGRAPAAGAANAPQASSLSLLGQAWDWLTGLWSTGQGEESTSPSKHRCTIDPDGVGCPGHSAGDDGEDDDGTGH